MFNLEQMEELNNGLINVIRQNLHPRICSQIRKDLDESFSEKFIELFIIVHEQHIQALIDMAIPNLVKDKSEEINENLFMFKDIYPYDYEEMEEANRLLDRET